MRVAAQPVVQSHATDVARSTSSAVDRGTRAMAPRGLGRSLALSPCVPRAVLLVSLAQSTTR